MIVESGFNPDDYKDQYDVYKNIITGDIDELGHFLKFYEGLSEKLQSGSVEIEDEFLIGRTDAISGGLEFFIGFSFESNVTIESIDNLVDMYAEERPDHMDFEVPDLTGRTNTLTVDLSNYDSVEIPEEFASYFDDQFTA